MSDSLYSEDTELKARAHRILLEALERAAIPKHRPQHHSDIYWWVAANLNQIEIRITHISFGFGWLTLSLYPESFAEHVVQFGSDDEESIATLEDALRYIKSVTTQLLTETNQLIVARRFNQLINDRDKLMGDQLRAGYALLGQPLRRGFEKRRKDAERRLAGEIVKRGGKNTKLTQDEIASIHIKYHDLHQIAKQIKREYDKEFKRFQKERGARGYNFKQWQKHWKEYAGNHYQEFQDFPMVFADLNSPSASEAAYHELAKQTDYTSSYLETLVTKARKGAKSR